MSFTRPFFGYYHARISFFISGSIIVMVSAWFQYFGPCFSLTDGSPFIHLNEQFNYMRQFSMANPGSISFGIDNRISAENRIGGNNGHAR